MKLDSRKVQTSLIAALTFYIVSSPITYSLTEKLFGGWTRIADHTGSPTGLGLFLHTIVFGVVSYLMMVAY
jgi:hypothetical protein